MVNNLKNLKNNQNKKISKKSAFSIIIGLLVAGVTGGASLIQSAKARALMNEVNNYKQGVMSYYAAKGRLPGDRLNLGKIGVDSGNEGEFEDAGYIGYTYGWLPFYDMNEEGIVDFDKDKEPSRWHGGKISNVIKNAIYSFAVLNSDSVPINIDEQLLGKNSLSLEARYFDILPPKILQYIDDKTDDGNAMTGKVLSICMDYPADDDYADIDEYNGDSNYKEAIDKKGFCREAFFTLDV